MPTYTKQRKDVATLMSCCLLAVAACCLGGCSWVAETLIVNFVERENSCATELSTEERVREFEAQFLRERDWEQYLEQLDLNQQHSSSSEAGRSTFQFLRR